MIEWVEYGPSLSLWHHFTSFHFHYHYFVSRPPHPTRVYSNLPILLTVRFNHSVVSDSLRPRESQHARPPCPSPTPRVHSDSCPLSQWCHPTISSNHLDPIGTQTSTQNSAFWKVHIWSEFLSKFVKKNFFLKLGTSDSCWLLSKRLWKTARQIAAAT